MDDLKALDALRAKLRLLRALREHAPRPAFGWTLVGDALFIRAGARMELVYAPTPRTVREAAERLIGVPRPIAR